LEGIERSIRRFDDDNFEGPAVERQVSIVDGLGSPPLSTIAHVRSALEAVDGFVADVMEDVAAKLTEAGLPGSALRERAHLDPRTKDECGRRNGQRPTSRTLRSSDFPGLGPVDVVLERPRALLELKWAYGVPAKIFESVWDATKLALLGAQHGYAALYVVCGASDAEWAVSESAELFAPGEIDVLALWQRPLIPPRGPQLRLDCRGRLGDRGPRQSAAPSAHSGGGQVSRSLSRGW
jgi:hypothetical protein